MVAPPLATGCTTTLRSAAGGRKQPRALLTPTLTLTPSLTNPGSQPEGHVTSGLN